MRLVVGLGNPGANYARTRHNVGFMVIDHLAKTLGATDWKKRHQARITKASGIILAKPQTYMNLSGESVYDIARNNAIPASGIIVVLDDLDMPLGRIRIRPKGGSAGHKGMQSIIDRMGTNEITRVKVGIGRPEDGGDPADYVLRRPTGTDKDNFLKSITTACDACLAIIELGTDAAMNRYNGTFVETESAGD